MIERLDAALSALLAEPRLRVALPELHAAETSFLTPDRNFVPDKDAVNLFLFETRENRELREALPVTRGAVPGSNAGTRRRAPVRVDCAYMVTTWSIDQGQDKVAAEHQLLGQAYAWLSGFPVLPLRFFETAARATQDFEPPTMLAQLDGARSVGEFWTALGVPPRPYFSLTVTIAMEVSLPVEEALVTTIASRYHAGDPAQAEERLVVAGTVRDRTRRPVPDAWVRLEPRGETATTDAQGRFVFERARRGGGNTLRARAPGFAEALRANFALPSPSGDYDLTFP